MVIGKELGKQGMWMGQDMLNQVDMKVEPQRMELLMLVLGMGLGLGLA
jgi:hypothetical protein